MSAHKPGVCSTCGGATGSTRTTNCKRCYGARGLEFASTRHGATRAINGIEVKGDQASLVATVDEPIRTLDDLIRVCKIDTAEWEIVSWKANKWEMGAKDETTQKIVMRPLFQVTAQMKRKVNEIRAKCAIQTLIADAKKQIAPRAAPRRAAPAGEHMLEISIPDLHIGKLAWSNETLGANYDHKIAIDLYAEALETLIQRTAVFRFNRVLLPIGNDFLHSDTKSGTTTGGTPLDMDSRYHKIYVAARKLLVRSIDRLRSIAPVTVVAVPGNHDALGTFSLADSLECWYHNTKDVVIDNAPSPRKYVRHGKVMLMFTHGNVGKRDNYPLLMATERPEMFGATVHRECHVGHLHQLQVKETMGVRVRVSPALCPADAWHSENHFVGNKRAAEAFVWHPTDGPISLATFTVPE